MDAGAHTMTPAVATEMAALRQEVDALRRREAMAYAGADLLVRAMKRAVELIDQGYAQASDEAADVLRQALFDFEG